MKRFWLVLLSLGLVMAFSVSAFAVDVKVSAEYYAAGMYLNKVSVDDGSSWSGPNRENPSTAFFFQRLRVGTDFIVSPCLKLVTRFDAMERIWGGARSGGYIAKPVDDDDDYSAPAYSAGTREENENIAVDLVYIDYTSPIGQFKVGYLPDVVWGTPFADFGNGNPAGQIQFLKTFGPATLFVGYAKEVDNSWSAVSAGHGISATRTDRDADSYRIGGIYNFKNGEAGALLIFNRDATNRGRSADGVFGDSYLSNVYVIDPYVKAKIGPVVLQAEAQYYFGDAAKYEGYVTGENNVSVGALSVFVDATANFGMFNVGGSAAYLSGDDPGTNDKLEGSGALLAVNTAGLDWDPCLILFNTQTAGYWVGPITGHTNSVVDNQMSNAWFFQGRVGVKPMPALDIMLAVSYAMADKKPVNPTSPHPDHTYANGTYGTEIDLTGTYKITNNLSYMMGAGYLFTGDYFKGFDRAGYDYKTNDDFILINKLTLTF